MILILHDPSGKQIKLEAELGTTFRGTAAAFTIETLEEIAERIVGADQKRSQSVYGLLAGGRRTQP